MAKLISLCDKLLCEGWFQDKSEILPWVMSGKILVDDYPVHSMFEKIPLSATIRIKEYYKLKYVSKGGIKLEHALNSFKISVENRIALDCGASTGGFTDCLINNGARLVYAVDAGFGQLSEKLIRNPKVVNMEKTNLADNMLKLLSPSPNLITLDLSYLSLKKALVYAKDIVKNDGEIIALIKPIFEVQSSAIRRSGKINDPDLHYCILSDLLAYFVSNSYNVGGLTYSPVRGNSGTIEYFVHLLCGSDKNNIVSDIQLDLDTIINDAFSLEKFKK